METAMFGGAHPPTQPLNPLRPLPPAVGVRFHIAAPDGLQATTVSLMDTLKRSRERLRVAVANAVLIADADSLVAPMWISMGGQCDFAATSVGDNAPDPDVLSTPTFLLLLAFPLLFLLPSSSVLSVHLLDKSEC